MTKAQAQRQLDTICKPIMKPQPVLTGIDKELAEQAETKAMWDELEPKP